MGFDKARWLIKQKYGHKLFWGFMSFDIRQLRYAIAAADHGSFYRAARALDVEQSTLSRAILKLERAIGDSIFNRSRAGVTLTIAGAQFIRSARPMVANADKMVGTMRAAGQGRAGGLMIGHYNSVSAGNLRATMLGWRDAQPDVDLDGVEAARGALFAGLDTGEIDIAILLGDASHDGFRHEPFWSERMIIALPASHPLADRDLLHWTDLRRERFLLTVADPGPEIRDTPAPAEPRGKPYFAAHLDEARQILTGCVEGSVRGEECFNAEMAVTEADARTRHKKFFGN